MERIVDIGTEGLHLSTHRGFLIVAKDRDWNEGAARAQFLKLLEVVGLEDPWVSGQRRRLSAILFT